MFINNYNLYIFIILSLTLYIGMTVRWLENSYAQCDTNFKIISQTFRDLKFRAFLISVLSFIVLQHLLFIKRNNLYDYWSFVVGTSLILSSFIFYFKHVHEVFVLTGFSVLFYSVFIFDFSTFKTLMKTIKYLSFLFFLSFFIIYIIQNYMYNFQPEDCTLNGFIEFCFISLIGILILISRIKYILRTGDIQHTYQNNVP